MFDAKLCTYLMAAKKKKNHKPLKRRQLKQSSFFGLFPSIIQYRPIYYDIKKLKNKNNKKYEQKHK